MWRRATNVAFWIGVSIYFGGILALGAVAAPAIKNAVQNAGISMPGVPVPPLEMRPEVTGQIFGEILARFTTVEVIALALMLVGIAGFLFAHTPVRRSAWILLIMWFGLAAFLAYDTGILRNKVWAQRKAMWQTAAAHLPDGSPNTWPERAEFNRLHLRSESLGRAKAYLLLGMIVVAAWRGLAERPIKHETQIAAKRPAPKTAAPTLHEEI